MSGSNKSHKIHKSCINVRTDYHKILDLFSKQILDDDNLSIFLEYPDLLDKWKDTWNENDRSNDNYVDIKKIEQFLEFVKTYSIDTKSPYFLSKLYSGSDTLSLLADMLISYYNTNVHVYSVSPVFTMAEHLMIDKIGKLITATMKPATTGTTYDMLNENAYDSGIFLPGGSYCNMVGLISARHKYVNSDSGPISIICSTKSHYSIDKAAIMMGIGLDQVIKVDFESTTLEELEYIIINNKVFCICSTFGTTSEGILESVERFRPIIKKYNVWHHVDACVGGILIYSAKNIGFGLGLGLPDSISMDFHKIADIAVQCSALILKSTHHNVLREVTDIGAGVADYLFHKIPGEMDKDHDISSLSFQCGRKADAFRLFVYDSLINMSSRVDIFIDRVREFNLCIELDQRFKKITNCNTLTHVLFTPIQIIERYGDNADTINVAIGQVVKMLRTENIFLEYHSNFIRIVPINPRTTIVEFKYILDRIDHHVNL